MRLTIACLAAIALTGCALIAPDDEGVLPSHPGGNVDMALATIAAHDGPVILSGHYVSAGTYWLGHPQACVVESARFTFHQPSVLGLLPWSQDVLDVYAHPQVIAMYRGGLREWYVRHFAKAGLGGVYGFRTLTAAQIVDMDGARWCD